MEDAAMKRVTAFTLIELLVVMAIIAVLATLGYAAADSVIGKGQATKCLSNMRQIGAAMQMFAGDHDGRLPGTSHGVSWTNSLGAYLGTNFLGKCPAVPDHRARVTYGWNDSLADKRGQGIRAVVVRTPSATMAAAELATNQSSEHFHFAGGRGGAARVTPNQFKAAVNVEVHNGNANYLFVDGHAENLAWIEVQRRLKQPGTTFLVP
jgi:prepilin-type N-terminal cleavage/methylation domain-containing protein/prepilin-type processing-associated H-X9-DG protein